VASILLVEDEADLSGVLRRHLEADGHQVRQAFTGPEGLAAALADPPDLILLDWMLPDLDGLALCRQVRQRHLVPIVMLTARGQEVDRVLGLEAGADDYILKPFSIREVLARVRAMLRRVELDTRGHLGEGIPAGSRPLVHGGLEVRPDERRVLLDGAPVELTPREFDLLALLAAHPGRAFSREFLLERLWGDAYDGYDRTVDTHVQRLRRKLGPTGDCIATVWGVGYRFTV
jgi:DNA-binding response OmpR family regulator